jgi:V/A-type H+-transporting ATPase subunit D
LESKLEPAALWGRGWPQIEISVDSQAIPYGPRDTTATLDEARQEWLAVLYLLQDYAEVVATVWKLAIELRKTQRRVNALESTIIPCYENSVDFIEQVLEEKDREEIVRAKKVKGMPR